MTENRRIVTKPSQTREPERSTVNHEGGGTVHPTLGGGHRVFRVMTQWGTAFWWSDR
jgi:hypothetical protein